VVGAGLAPSGAVGLVLLIGFRVLLMISYIRLLVRVFLGDVIMSIGFL
jgi:hypothetical protein